MQGVPYPAILAGAVLKAERARSAKIAKNKALREQNPNTRVRDPKPLDINGIIRKLFDLIEMIEDVVRFQYIQLGKAYVDILHLALRKSRNDERVQKIF